MTHVLSILDHADHNAWKHHVVYATDDRRPGVDSYREELAQRRIPGFSVPVRQNITSHDALAIARTLALMARLRPAVVHCHSTKAGAVGRVCAALYGRKPTVFTPHSFSFQMAEKNSRKHTTLLGIERMLGRVTDRLAAVSETEYALAVNERVCPAARTALIPNGVDFRRADDARAQRQATRQSLGLGESDPVICFIGRFAPQKMPHIVVEAAASLARKGCRPTVLMLGNGPLEDDIQKLIKTRGVEQNFRWLGWQAYDDALRYLAAADIMVLPSRYEGLPYVALEAQAVGTIPILTRVPGSQDAIQEGKTGLMVPFDDAEALGDAIKVLIDDPAQRASLALAGAAYVRENFNAVQMVQSIETLYQQVTLARGKKVGVSTSAPNCPV